MIIEGARQVGKTWLMKEFGRQAYEDTIYINFDSNTNKLVFIFKLVNVLFRNVKINVCYE